MTRHKLPFMDQLIFELLDLVHNNHLAICLLYHFLPFGFRQRRSFLSLVNVTMSALGHRQTGSVSQNHKAQLASAYNELGKELSSQKVRVIGNYTLGKAIGEGERNLCRFHCCIQTEYGWQGPTGKCAWAYTD